MARNDYILECCVDSVDSAMTAADCGADRLELCSNLIIGGTTPTLALYDKIREQTAVRLHVLVRPRFGDFYYQPMEFAVMLKEVEQFHLAGADGVVFGCLTPDGALCPDQMKRLVEAAGSMQITLHRAFDMCRDPFQTLEDAISLGIHTILTSGQKDTALLGLPLLQALEQAAAGRIQIMPGAGINAAVIRTFLQETDISCFHMSGKKILSSQMVFKNPDVHMGIAAMSEYEMYSLDKEALLSADAVLRN